MKSSQVIEITNEEANQRLDRWLRKKYPTLNQGKIEQACRKGELRINKGRVKPSSKLESGQLIRVPPYFTSLKKNLFTNIKFSENDSALIRSMIIYQDEHIYVLNKSPGIASQGGTGQNNRHLDYLIGSLSSKEIEKPRLVHRLDKDTSGVLILAKNRMVAEKMALILRQKKIRKIYWALVAGSPPREVGTIKYGLVKRNKVARNNSSEMVECVHPDEIKDLKEAKQATTDYVVIEKVLNRATWVGLSPITGRTHQLRAHMSQIGCPIIGDGKYGLRHQENNGAGWGAHIGGLISKKMHLHARSVSFEHPISGQNLFFEANLPLHMKKSWDTFGWNLQWAPKDPFKIHE